VDPAPQPPPHPLGPRPGPAQADRDHQLRGPDRGRDDPAHARRRAAAQLAGPAARADRDHVLLPRAVPLRVVALPDPHPLRAENPLVPDGLAEPPPAPLQARGLLAGRQLEPRRPRARDETRPEVDREAAAGTDARGRGRARGYRWALEPGDIGSGPRVAERLSAARVRQPSADPAGSAREDASLASHYA